MICLWFEAPVLSAETRSGKQQCFSGAAKWPLCTVTCRRAAPWQKGLPLLRLLTWERGDTSAAGKHFFHLKTSSGCLGEPRGNSATCESEPGASPESWGAGTGLDAPGWEQQHRVGSRCGVSLRGLAAAPSGELRPIPWASGSGSSRKKTRWRSSEPKESCRSLLGAFENRILPLNASLNTEIIWFT